MIVIQISIDISRPNWISGMDNILEIYCSHPRVVHILLAEPLSEIVAGWLFNLFTYPQARRKQFTLHSQIMIEGDKVRESVFRDVSLCCGHGTDYNPGAVWWVTEIIDVHAVGHGSLLLERTSRVFCGLYQVSCFSEDKARPIKEQRYSSSSIIAKEL
ncbi:hypothetical protein D3C80_502450 [compost metagenome]